jgi:hypothetical protein
VKDPDASYDIALSVNNLVTGQDIRVEHSRVPATEVVMELGQGMAAMVSLFDPESSVQLVNPADLADIATQVALAQPTTGDETRVTNEVLHRTFSLIRDARSDMMTCLRRGDMPSRELTRNASNALTEAYRLIHNLVAPSLGEKPLVPVLSSDVGDVVPVRLGFDIEGRSVWRNSAVSIQPEGAVGCVHLKPSFSSGELERLNSLTPTERDELRELRDVQARLEKTKAILDETSDQLITLTDVVSHVVSVGTPPDEEGEWGARCWICRTVLSNHADEKAAYQALAGHLKERCWLSEWRMDKFAEAGTHVDATDVHVGDEVRVEFAGADGVFPEFDYEKASGEDLEGIGSVGFVTGIVTSYGDGPGLGIDEEGTLLVAPPNGPARRVFLIKRGPESQALTALQGILIDEGTQSQMLSTAFDDSGPDGLESNPRLSAAENVVMALEEQRRTAVRRGGALAQLGHAAGFPTPKTVAEETQTFRALVTVLNQRRREGDAPLADQIRAALRAGKAVPEIAKRSTTYAPEAVSYVVAALEAERETRRSIEELLMDDNAAGLREVGTLDDPAGFDAHRLAKVARLIGLDVKTDDGKESGMPIRIVRPGTAVSDDH